MGDNDWNDCANPADAKVYWESIFLGFETKYWPPKFVITRQAAPYEHIFSFINKNIMYIGLNLVRGRIVDQLEWNTRLDAQAIRTMDLIRNFKATGTGAGVVIFGHADPEVNGSNHARFFTPLTTFISTELRNSLPILYMNGDKHVWDYDTIYKGQSSLLRITLQGTATQPPTLFTIDGALRGVTPSQ